jgi:hypothetical protein
MRRITRRTVCTAESKTEFLSAISYTLHNMVEKWNSYHLKFDADAMKRRRRRFRVRHTVYHIYQGQCW